MKLGKNAAGNPREVGERQRKKVPRAELANWDAGARTGDPLRVLKRAMAGRLASLAELKVERMRCSAFSFFRGAVPVMAWDLARGRQSGICVQLCGDAHVQNMGSYAGADGRLVFDINDFDETMRGPFEWDVKRMATSILLAGQDAELKAGAAVTAVETFLNSYCELMQRFSQMPVLEVARFQVHRLTAVSPISRILEKAERATPAHSLERLTEDTKKGRRFRHEPPVLRRVSGAEAKRVLGALRTYAASLLPERRHFLGQFRALDVAFKVVGTGSVGLRDYCVYLQGNGPGDPLFLQIKQEMDSAYAPYLPAPKPGVKHQGQRVVEGQRALQLQSDPLLGWTTLAGRHYLVRQLNDHKAGLDIAGLTATDLSEFAGVAGELLARGHARSGDSRVLAGYIGAGKQFRGAMLEFAEVYAAQSVADWKEMVGKRRG